MLPDWLRGDLRRLASTLVSLPLSWLVSSNFDNSITPLVGGFAIAGVMSLALMRWAERA